MKKIVLLGDSNTDYGYNASDVLVAVSYISNQSASYPTIHPFATNNAFQLAGMIEATYLANYGEVIIAVNHGLGGTNTGTGFGLTGGLGPNARYSTGGVTRFEAEVLGVGRPTWTANSIPRVRAFYPGQRDFAYISLGTNDCRYGVSYVDTITNLTWMIDTWIAAGCPASHLMIATIPPPADTPACNVLSVNASIRTLVAAKGCKLIDLGDYTTTDGETWKDVAAMAIDDNPAQVHYTAAVRQWIADQIVVAMHDTTYAECAIAAHNHS